MEIPDFPLEFLMELYWIVKAHCFLIKTDNRFKTLLIPKSILIERIMKFFHSIEHFNLMEIKNLVGNFPEIKIY
jgi:hypothetical protein